MRQKCYARKWKRSYKSIYIQIKQIWNLKFKIIPVMTGATGIVTKVFGKNLKVIPGKHSIYSLKKVALLQTSYVIWKVLQSET